MTESGPSLKSQNLWAKREAKCLAILKQALLLLRVETSIPEAEVDLNRMLYFCLLRASRELCPNEEVAPTPECNNQPDPDDEARSVRELKRPDFQWIYLDKYEANPDRSSKQFVVECKRLGRSKRTDWILNTNYVIYGVRRFRDAQWSYAKRFATSAMVGYLQSMEAEDVLTEVNNELRKNSLTDIAKKGSWKPKEVSHLEHTFERGFEVSPFCLRHLWIDLRVKS